MRPTLLRPAFALAFAAAVAPLGAQSVQYISADGTPYRSLPDTGTVERAAQAYRRAPTVENAIALGTAQASRREFREAIETFTAALVRDPNEPRLLRWRGHRYLTLRDFGRAKRDLERAVRLDSTLYGAWYHLGIVHVVLDERPEAVRAFSRALPLAPDAAERAGSVDWLWMSLMEARRPDAAAALLARRPDSIPVENAYARRLRLYRGEIGPDEVITAADSADVQHATLAFGVANWYRLRGDSASAQTWYRRAIAAGGWPGFGFIVAEQRLGPYGQRDFGGLLGGRACISRQDVSSFPRATAKVEIPSTDEDAPPRGARAVLEAVEGLVGRAAREFQREVSGQEGVIAGADSLFRHDELQGQMFVVVHRDDRVVVSAESAIGMDPPRRFAAIQRLTAKTRALVEREPPAITWPRALRVDSLVVPVRISAEAAPVRRGRPSRPSPRLSVPLFTIHAPEETAVAVLPGAPAPEYPPGALRLGYEGRVDLRFIVDSAGHIDLRTVRDVFVEDATSARRRMEEDVYQAFRNEVVAILPVTRFRPAMIGGCAVPQVVQIPFQFQLQR